MLTSHGANVAVNAVCARLDNGCLRIFEDEKLLAELRYGDKAFQPAKDGVAVSNQLQPDLARDDGTANRCEHVEFGGKIVLRGTVGVADEDLVLDSVDFQWGAPVSIESVTITQQN